MKDNEKVILIVLGIIAVIVLPYVLFSKQAKEDTAAINTRCQELEAEYNRLHEMDLNRKFYLDETERYDTEIAEIVKKFPADIADENTTLMLLDTEYGCHVPETMEGYVEYEILHGFGILPALVSLAGEGERDLAQNADDTITLMSYEGLPNGAHYRANVPVVFNDVAFGDKIETPIASEGIDTGMFAVTNDTLVSYRTYYPGFKYLLAHFMEMADPMTYPSFTAEFDEETGTIKGTFMLTQFAIIDENDETRKLEPYNWVVEKDWKVDVDGTYGRGNVYGPEGDGIFGPKEQDYNATEEDLEILTEIIEEIIEEEH